MEANKPRLEELINRLELLKQALQYYSNTANYEGDNPNILLDKGSQAKFALDTLTNQENYHETLVSEADEILKQYGQESSNDQETLNKLTEINKLLNRYKSE